MKRLYTYPLILLLWFFAFIFALYFRAWLQERPVKHKDSWLHYGEPYKRKVDTSETYRTIRPLIGNAEQEQVKKE